MPLWSIGVSPGPGPPYAHVPEVRSMLGWEGPFLGFPDGTRSLSLQGCRGHLDQRAIKEKWAHQDHQVSAPCVSQAEGPWNAALTDWTPRALGQMLDLAACWIWP
jgi:hypothetical protein